MRKSPQVWIPVLFVAFATVAASAQSFRVQCPPYTITHPLTGTSCSTNPTGPGCNNTEPAVQRTDAIHDADYCTGRHGRGLCCADCRRP